MKTCQKCGKTNRNEASYCKWCGERLVAVAEPVEATGSGAAVTSTGSVTTAMPDGMIAKDCVKEPLANFTKRCEQTAEFRKRTGSDVRPGLDCIITGETGTGKTYLAGKLAQILYHNKVTENLRPKTVDAADWNEFNSKLDENLTAIKTGVLVVTNCQNLVNAQGGSSQLDKLFARMKVDVNMPVVILCGLEDGFGTFIRANSNALSLFEFRFSISPFKDNDLKTLCVSLIKEKFRTPISPDAERKLGLVFKKMFRDGCTKENGILAGKIAEESAFNMFSRGGSEIEATDIQREPFEELTEEQIMDKINAFTGLTEVKQEIRTIIDNIKRQKRDNPGKPVQLKSHFVFTGNPGTGKTTMARLFADILGSLQVLPSGHLVEVTRKDLVSQYVGDTALKTEQVINKAMGGILFIDEAYTLKQGDNDKVGQEAIDTLLPYLENRAGDFICIVAGYTKEMTMFLRSNSGLDSRFKKKIEFKDYNGKELTEIFLNMVKKKGLSLSDEAAGKVGKYFERMYLSRTDTFGNARDVRNIFDLCFERLCTRTAGMSNDEYARSGKVMTWEDIPYNEPKVASEEECLAELDSLIGLKSVKNEIRSMLNEMRQRKMDSELSGGNFTAITPDHYLFLGNPGTGKTTVARLMGRILYSLGVIARPDVIEVSRADMVASFVGQTAPKTREVVDRAMGGILFIDEAYSLIQGYNDSFGNECVTELLKLLEDRKGKFVCVAAGYTREMTQFLDSNSGLKSRFTKAITFEDYKPEELMDIFKLYCRKEGYSIDPEAETILKSCFRNMYDNRSFDFGNGREVRNMFGKVKSAVASRSYSKMKELVSEGADRQTAYEDSKPKTITKEDLL